MNYPVANITKAPMKSIEEVIERAKKSNYPAIGKKFGVYRLGIALM
jgi:hypothetical protein